MSKLPILSGKGAIKAFERLGYEAVRTKGSHVRLTHPDRNLHLPLTIPLHKTLGPGLLRKLIRDARITPDEFHQLLG